ncbi:hypothetical protein ACWFNS_04755 [Oerskovia enterophila]
MPDWIGLTAAAAVPLLVNWCLGYISYDGRTVRRIKADRSLLEATDHDSPERAAFEREIADRFDHLVLYRDVVRLRGRDNVFPWITVALVSGAVFYVVYLVTIRKNATLDEVVLVVAWVSGIAGVALPVVTDIPMYGHKDLESERLSRLNALGRRKKKNVR